MAITFKRWLEHFKWRMAFLCWSLHLIWMNQPKPKPMDVKYQISYIEYRTNYNEFIRVIIRWCKMSFFGLFAMKRNTCTTCCKRIWQQHRQRPTTTKMNSLNELWACVSFSLGDFHCQWHCCALVPIQTFLKLNTEGEKQKKEMRSRNTVCLNVVDFKNFSCRRLPFKVVACLCRHTPIGILWY